LINGIESPELSLLFWTRLAIPPDDDDDDDEFINKINNKLHITIIKTGYGPKIHINPNLIWIQKYKTHGVKRKCLNV
jgi:hypothetical protein